MGQILNHEKKRPLLAVLSQKDRNPFFHIFSYSSFISLSIKLSFGGTIFIFNSLNGHYLYSPFFPNTKAKEGKTNI